MKKGSVLLVRRGRPPQEGEWTLPGGLVELGEPASVAVRRELREETGLRVDPVKLAAVFERIIRRGRRVRYHYAVLDYLCRLRGGRLQPGSDALDARWVAPKDLGRYQLRRTTRSVIGRALRIWEAKRLDRPGQPSGKPHEKH